MDPLSLSASAAGFFGLAVQIRTMLKGYISGIRNAPSEAGLLLAEIASLCSVLENLITFLGNQDLQQCRFDKTSVLRAAIEAGKEQLEGLYIKLAEIRDAFSGGKEKFKDGVVVKDGIREGISNAVKEKVERVRWPLKKVDFQSTMGELQRFTQTFGFSLTVENCKLLAETSAEVLKKLDEKDKTINGVMDQLKAISISIPAEMLSQQTQILEIKTLVVNLGERTVKELQSISRGVDNVQERLQDSEIEKILSWISPLEPQKRHYDIRQKRLEGTGGWFLQQLEFQQWIDEYSPKQNSTDTGSILTCSGIPGAGKSVICSLVIDDLITRFPPEGDVCVAYLYCDYRDQLDQTPVNMIGALLKQAISTLNESYSLPEELVEALRKRQKKRGGEQLNLKESHDFLVKAVKQFEKFYICLDALDECNTKHCANLLESLANVTKESSQECEIRLFVTGRPHLGWEDYIRRHPSLGAPVHICLEANQDDIRKFIAHEIEVDDNEDCMNDTLKNEIVERIVKNSDRMFLLPALQIQTILDQPTISKRRKALLTMPTELGDAFGATINRMRNQRSERSIQALDVLKLVFRSRRRMTPNEIRHYLAVDISDQALDWDNLPSEKSLVEWCLGLVVIDEETSTARLVHKSLHEYLSKLFKEGKIFQDSDGVIALTCLTYMHFIDTENSSNPIDPLNKDAARTILKSRVERFALLDYAITNWGHHARHQTTKAVETLAVSLLLNKLSVNCISSYLFSFPLHQDQSHHNVMSRLLGHWDPDRALEGMLSGTRSCWGLQLIAYFGLESLFHILIGDLGNHVNSKIRNWTPLMMATYHRHRPIVRLLLEREDVDVNLGSGGETGQNALSIAVTNHGGKVLRHLLEQKRVDVNYQGYLGMSALCLAADIGNVEALCLLLQMRDDVDINSKDVMGRTALAIAAHHGYVEIVRRLLNHKDICINSRTLQFGLTPLSMATQKGHHTIVRLLLSREALDINSKDTDGRTALFWAVEKGHESIVRLLLDIVGIDINAKLSDGRSSLLIAVQKQDEAIAHLLLARIDIDIDVKTNKDGRTTLSWAAENGLHSIMCRLLEKAKVDIHEKDNHGRTLLSYAAENGHTSIVNLLLTSDDCDINTKDDHGMNPLLRASFHGHHSIVRLLLEKGNIDVNVKWDNYMSSTSLLLAIQRRHQEVARLLLKRKDTDINAKEKSLGYSALSMAVANKDEEIIRLLLQRIDIDANLKANDGQTALSLAIQGGDEAIVCLLIGRHDVNINAINNCSGQNVLSWAIENRYTSIVKSLLKRGDVNVHSGDNKGQTPLSLASENGDEATVCLLLDLPSIDITSTDRLGYTPLLWAVNSGYETVVRLLMAKGDVGINMQDKRGRTALSRASERGHDSVVRILLDRREIDVNSRDDDGYTALSRASEMGHNTVVRLLLEQNNIDVNLKGRYNCTALSSAAQKGHATIARLLLEREDVDIHSKDGLGQTSLSLAAENGHEAVVRLLLGKRDIRVNSKDRNGRAALSYAAEKGHESIVRLILERTDTRINSKDRYGRTALSWASKRHHNSIVELLRIQADTQKKTAPTSNKNNNNGRSPLKKNIPYSTISPKKEQAIKCDHGFGDTSFVAERGMWDQCG